MTSDTTPVHERDTPRGRPRDAARDRALLDATVVLLTERGYGALTTAAVAAAAGVSTATLYRRWRSKEDLVAAAAMMCGQEFSEAVDTGTLEGDLRTVLRGKAAFLTGTGGRLLRALLGEAAHNATLADALATAFTVPMHERVSQVVRRAVDRGEIPPVGQPELLADLVMGPMISRWLLVTRMPEDSDAVHAGHTADELLPFLLRALGTASDRSPGTVPDTRR
ncbi:TetR-like C-terminal domain-containing protein [Streptomyces sp. AC495_CC817]|uniref:TetR-like C-terminal domain-containing protein n=1 Tax=Streptomyces sp. AC495_CC817 TaxID=2823900 RepID=UPI001C26383D|nr:TetR-like C-terminal domain-containing protein [Streptomyces sp. AC495_CC817]